MAGYIIQINSNDSLRLYVENGVYAVKVERPSGIQWSKDVENLYAHFLAMQAGDNIYFVSDNTIFGIGELIEVSGACKFLNFPGAARPEVFSYEAKKPELLWDKGEHSIDLRWLFLFRPSPHFFVQGVELAEILAFNCSKFPGLRGLGDQTVMKLDHRRNQIIKDALLRKNEDVLRKPDCNGFFPARFREFHKVLAQHFEGNHDYHLDPAEILSACAKQDALNHETALTMALGYQITQGDLSTVDLFGEWDSISHQRYNRFKLSSHREDGFMVGYRFLPGFRPTISKYLLVKGVTGRAERASIDGVMGLVDSFNDCYVRGDYSLLEAVLVARGFSRDVIAFADARVKRNYTVGGLKSRSWSGLRLISYSFNQEDNRVDFSLAHDFDD